MSDTRRVVVTGLGRITPVGLDVEETWDALNEGRSGGAPISRDLQERMRQAQLPEEVARNYGFQQNLYRMKVIDQSACVGKSPCNNRGVGRVELGLAPACRPLINALARDISTRAPISSPAWRRASLRSLSTSASSGVSASSRS